MPKKVQTDSEMRRDLVLAIDAWKRGDHEGAALLLRDIEDKHLALGTLTVLCVDLLDTANRLSRSKRAGDDLLSAWKQREQGYPDEDERGVRNGAYAKRFLLDHLGHGRPMRVSILKALALSDGIKFETLRNAARSLEVIADPPTGGNVPYRTWRLPHSVRKPVA